MGIQLGARVVSMPISLITGSLTARTLDPTGFGVWTAVSAYVGIVGTVTGLGFTTVAMQKMASEPEREGAWLGALAQVNLLSSVIGLAACAVSLPFFLSAAHQQHLVGLILALTILSSPANSLMAVFQTRLRSGLVSSFGLIQSVIWLILVVVFWRVGASVVVFAIGYVSVLVVISALQVGATRRYAEISWRQGRHLWGSLTRIAVPIGIANVLIIVYYQIDAVLLLKLAGAHEAGEYGAAYRFLTPLQFFPAAIMSSFFPVLSAVKAGDPARMRRLVQLCAELMAIVSLPVLALTLILSGPIIRLLYGAGFARAAGVLPILMIAFVSICYGNLAGFLAPLLNLNWRLALFSGLGAIANVVLNLVLIPPFGAFGSAWATVITEVLTMMLMLATSLLALRLPIRLGPLIRIVALAAAMTGLLYLCRRLGLVPAAILGLGFYAGGTLALGIIDLDSLRGFRSGGGASNA